MKSAACLFLFLHWFCAISESQGFALDDHSKTALTLHQATVINERYQQLVTKLNENFKTFLKTATTSQNDNFKSNANHETNRNSLALEELLTAANEKRLNYGPVIENMDKLLSQQNPEQLLNFIRLVKQGSKNGENNGKGRINYQTVDAWLDIFSAVDLSEMSEIVVKAPQVMKGITDLLGGVVKAVETVGGED